MRPIKDNPDVVVEDQGTIILFRTGTEEAEAWLREHTDGLWWGKALCVEPRYASELVEGLDEAGLVVVAA